ncbi:MAG: glutathione S-transferase N-terminal domain-containing protein [Polyangiaceae bacterium]
MAKLIHLHYSPWSERARWALDHHGVAVERVEYLPMVGEPWLRWHLGRWRGRVTVPVLIDGIERFDDSLDIARWAEARGKGAPLFPSGSAQRIEALVALAEEISAHGRARATAAVARHPEALLESVPPPLNASATLARVTGVLGVRFLRGKYSFMDATPAELELPMRPLLERVAEALAGRKTLLDDFSFADIAVASSLQFVGPVDSPTIRLGPASRQAWTSPELSKRFADLVAWRDELYANWR